VATKNFEVVNYTLNIGYKMSGTWGGVKIQIQGYVACAGVDGSALIVFGLHPDSPVPPTPVYNVATNMGGIFVPFSEIGHYVDIVRNEKPVYAYLDSDNPDWISLCTSLEPIGEGEN
jgi:hypothetical protein